MVAVSNEESICGNRNTVNSTIFFDVDPYGGIPSNLIINVVAFIVFLLIFLIFHKKAYQSVNEIIRIEHLKKQSNILNTSSSEEVQTVSFVIKEDKEGH